MRTPSILHAASRLSPGRVAALVAIAAIAAIAGCAGRPPAPFTQGSERYRFECQVMEAPGEPGTFSVTGMVRDEEARRTILVPRFTVRKGATADARATDAATGALLELTVTVDENGRTATWRGQLTNGGQLTASRNDTLTIRN